MRLRVIIIIFGARHRTSLYGTTCAPIVMAECQDGFLGHFEIHYRTPGRYDFALYADALSTARIPASPMPRYYAAGMSLFIARAGRRDEWPTERCS